MNRRALFIIIVSILLVICTSCSVEEDAVISLSKCQVPFYCYSSHWSEVKLIDEDEYGRKMYLCSSLDESQYGIFLDFTQQEEFKYHGLFYIIIQDVDSDTVSYYEDICYMFVPSAENTDENIMAEFKESNDWGESLNETKISSLNYKENELVTSVPVKGSYVYQLIEEKYGILTENLLICQMWGEFGEQIYIIREISDDEPLTVAGSYIFVADENNGIVSSAELEGTFSDWPEQIAIFKNCVLHEN